MKKKPSSSNAAFFNRRALCALFLCLIGSGLAVVALGASQDVTSVDNLANLVTANGTATVAVKTEPRESRLVRTSRSFTGDLRSLAKTPPLKIDPPEREDPAFHRHLSQK